MTDDLIVDPNGQAPLAPLGPSHSVPLAPLGAPYTPLAPLPGNAAANNNYYGGSSKTFANLKTYTFRLCFSINRTNTLQLSLIRMEMRH